MEVETMKGTKTMKNEWWFFSVFILFRGLNRLF